MKTFKSLYFSEDLIPEDSLIINALLEVGYEGFIPKTFIADLLVISKYRLLQTDLPAILLKNEYCKSIYEIIKSINIVYWMRDTMYLLKRIASKHNLRTIEIYAAQNIHLELSDIEFSFNYIFDIKEVNKDVCKLLNITDNQIDEIEKLPDEVIEILTVANGLGSFLKTSKQIVSSNKQMTSYGDITKIHKHLYADLLFKYKFSIKAYDIDSDKIIQHKSNKIVLGYYIGSYNRYSLADILIKLLGVIIINNFSKGIEITVYSFFLDSYSKVKLTAIEEIIDYFSNQKQLKLFAINNSKALESMIIENLGNDIIFLPNTDGSCYLNSNLSGSNRINIISIIGAKHNLEYANICKKTGGTFLTL